MERKPAALKTTLLASVAFFTASVAGAQTVPSQSDASSPEGQPSMAQEATATTPESPTSASSPEGAEPAQVPAGGIGDVVVTARKRQERIQDVPVAITALDTLALQRTNATSITDLSGIAPNVTLQNFTVAQFNLTAVIRGIGTADFEPSADPAVALFIDGVYQPASNGAAIGLLDTESLEILRGPQGTLFGRNATAGAILVRTKRPQQEWGLEALGTIGNYGQLTTAAAVTGPVVKDVLAFRLSGSVDTSQGYYKNFDGRQLGGKEIYSFRPSILFTPSPDLDIFVTGEYVRDYTDTIPPINAFPAFGGSLGADRGDYNTTVNESLDFKSTAKSVTTNVDYRAGIGTFSLIANHREFKYRANFDTDGTPLTVLAVDRNERHNQDSIEGRFASSFNGAFNFVAGVSYIDHRYNLLFVGRDSILVGLPGSDPGLPVLVVQNAQTSKNFAAYFQGTLKFGDLSIDLGANYGREKKDFDFLQATVFFVPQVPQSVSKTWSNFGPKVGINYKINKDVLAYASYSRGFRSGGFNGRAFDPRNLGPYEPEKVDAFEVGLKSDFFDRTIRLNLSAFYNKYKDLQRPFPNFVGYNGTTPNPLELVTFNAAGANIKGVEGELTWRPVSELTLTASASYLDAKYDGFADPSSGASLDDLKLAYAPKFDSRIGAAYRLPLGAWYGELAGDYQHTSSMFVESLNSPVGFRKPTDVVNASLTFGQQDGPLTVTGFVRNLTKEVYVVSAQPGDPFLNVFTINPPRTYGLTFRAKF
jgi:iron complex outermembrane recepter protein